MRLTIGHRRSEHNGIPHRAVLRKGNAFEADIVTKDNALADKVFIDKNTGWMRSAY